MLIFLPLSNLYSEEICGSVTNCPDKPYKYWFCNNANNQMVEFCEKNPYSLLPGFTPMKAPIPICFEYKTRSSDPQEIKLPIQVGGEVVVYNKNKTQNDIDNAEYGWNCICGKEEDECECTLEVGFVTDKSKWPTNNYRLAMISFFTWEVVDCEIICFDKRAKIMLNNLPEFNQKMSGYRLTSYSNEEYSVNLFEVRLGYRTYNLTDLLYKAIGQQYGLRVQDGNPECNPPYEGRMGKGYTMGQGSKGLSRDDKCMFKKLYCPNLVPVEYEYVEEMSDVANFPNPLENKTYFSFSVPEEGCYVIITVYNQVGKVVALPLNKYYSTTGQQNEIFDASELPAGFYYYTIQLGKEIKTNKMIVSR